MVLVGPGAYRVGRDQACRYAIQREGVPVPDLVGMPLEHAAAAARRLSQCLEVRVVNTASDGIAGTVLRQDPEWPSTTVDHVIDVVLAR